MIGKIFFFLSLIIVCFPLAAQDLFDLDFDSLFDEPLFDESEEEEIVETQSILGNVRRRGISFTASYEFQGAVAPGWDLAPWDFNGEENFSWGLGVKMSSGIDINAQISENFRVFTNVNFHIPGFQINLGDFFFDYNFFNAVFLRAGKYEQGWGISPNFGFTNILSRVPSTGPSGPSYVAKADIPFGVGGFQLIALTRSDINKDVQPTSDDIGFGGKYNLALRWVDLDLGAFYQKTMATRGILSVKTTLWNTELYYEWLFAVNTHTDNNVSMATNIGFARDFFNERIGLNGEFFYNGEQGSYFFQPETNIREAETSPFIEGINIALNVLYRFSGRINPRFFTQVLYAPQQNSVRLVPGFTISPLQNIEIYFAVPMALGNKEGYYYKHTADPHNRPFSIMLYITLKGSVQAGFFY